MPPYKVSPARFLDVAFSGKGPCSTSYHYYHHHHLLHLKWLIRKDLLSLLRDFSSLSLSTVPTTSSTGGGGGGSSSSSSTTTTGSRSSSKVPHLLAASGPLNLPSLQLHLTIILHPSHPYAAPLVQVCTIPTLHHHHHHHHHPFVDPVTGHTTTPYLLSWKHPKSNLPDLVRNLVNIFTFWPIHTLPSHPHRLNTASVSRREATDRLTMLLLHDMASFNSQVEAQIHTLRLQLIPTLSHRSTQLDLALQSLHDESTALRSVVDGTTKATAALEDWLTTWASDHQLSSSEEADHYDTMVLEAFEGIDERSEKMLEHAAEDLSIEDVMVKLDKELDKGTITLEHYLKHIRTLASEQFNHRKDRIAMESCSLLDKVEPLP